jgi:alpha-glucosidase
VKDPIGKIGWPEEKGRDGERTPMQWDASKNAGFTKADKPWLSVPPSAAEINVSAESRNPVSLLNFYKKLISLRRAHPALRNGRYLAVNTEDENVLSYLRKNAQGESVLVALNMSAEPRKIEYKLSSQGIRGGKGRPLVPLRTAGTAEIELSHVTLPPFGILMLRVQ